MSTYYDSTDRNAYIALGAILGVVAGISVGMLLTPRSGAETRRLFRERSMAAKQQARERLMQKREMAMQSLGKSRDMAVQSLSKSLDKSKSVVDKAVDKTAQRAENAASQTQEETKAENETRRTRRPGSES